MAAAPPPPEPEPSPEPAPAPAPKAANGGGPSKNARKLTERLERAVEEAEAELARVEEELADPSAWGTQYESAKSTARHTAAKRAVEQAYAELEAHLERIGA